MRLHLLDAAVPDAAGGDLENSGQADFINGVGDETKIGQDILDFLAVVELDAAGNLIGNLFSPQGIFHHAGEGVHAIEDRHLAPLIVVLLGQLLQLGGDDVGFVIFVGAVEDPGFFAGGVLIPLAFTVIMTMLPKAKQPIGLTMFALGATFAPAIAFLPAGIW